MPSRLLQIRQWPNGNSCTWAHDVRLHIAGTNEPKSTQQVNLLNTCSECSCTDTDVCIKCEQNQEFEIAQKVDERKDLQKDNNNDSISYQLL